METENDRVTDSVDGEVVVFLIGMRVNRWWKFWQWLRTAAAMPKMIDELERHPELGFLGAESWFGRTTMMVSYWKSAEDLLAYARSRTAKHLPAWRAFNKYIGTSGDVGIWHETYKVRAGEHESVYVNMPSFGLGRVAGVRKAIGQRSSAAGRLGARRGSPFPI